MNINLGSIIVVIIASSSSSLLCSCCIEAESIKEKMVNDALPVDLSKVKRCVKML